MLSLEEKRTVLERSLIEDGFIVRDGLKYGLDFLVYTDIPDRVHSKYGVVVDSGMTYQEMVSLQRVCCASNKILVIAFINSNSEIEYLLCDRFVTHGSFDERGDQSMELNFSALSL